MKVLVTGGAGFIGSNLVKYLCDKGHNVFMLDDLSSGSKDLIDQRSKFFHNQIVDQEVLAEILPQVEVVFHLAAKSLITESLDKPESYFQNNVMQGVWLLDAMRKHNVKKIVYSSSAAAYGSLNKDLITENESLEPISPYGASKLAFEPILSSYYHAFGIEAVALRYFNVYGPNDDQADTPRAVPIWIKAALKDEPLPLFWQGRQKRDYVFVEDVARANLLSAEKGQGFSVYNVASGQGIWMYDILEKINQAFGGNLKIKDMGERQGDPQILVADVNKIKNDLGWQPQVSFTEGLERTIAHYKMRMI